MILFTAFLIGVAVLLNAGPDIRTVINEGLQLLRAAGPATFFLCMALLPAVGAPLSFFCLTVGPAFGPDLGLGLVMLLSLSAIAANMALSFVMARHALRPPLEYLLKKLGHRLPQASSGDSTDLIVLLRVTPGVPFVVQNYLLGLSGVPFARYLLVSCLIVFPLNAAIIFFGEALLEGRGRSALLGLLGVLAVLAAVQLVRRRYRHRGTTAGGDPTDA